ncbi:MAG: hypothetical protein GQ527_11805 [Bacteroidales bacterium]|nr:hypothetical protein [Bacteroidales bacterium]
MKIIHQIQQAYHWLINPDKERIVSKRIYLNYLLFIIFISSLALIIANNSLGLKTELYFSFSLFIGSILLWISNRNIKNLQHTLSAGFIWLLVIYNIFYFINNGSQGPVFYYLFPFIFMIVYFSNKRSSYYLFAILLLNLIGIGIIDYYSEIDSAYTNRSIQFLDHYLSYIVADFVMITLFLNIIKLQLKEKKIANESNQLKTSFLANTSSHVKTPAMNLQEQCRLLDTKELSKADLSNIVNKIHTYNNQLLLLVTDIFDISIIDSGNIVLNKRKIHLNIIIEEVFEDTKMKIESSTKSISLQFHCGLSEKHNIIFADPVRIKQVLSNLIQNALIRTEKGAIIFGYDILLNSKEIQFYVKDTGSIIPHHKHQDIFKRHNNNEVSEDLLNTNLSLYISSNLVKIMKGKIRFTSIQSKGSNFYFTIPLEKKN